MKKTLSILFPCISLCACQKTPNENVVNQRSYEKLLETSEYINVINCPTEYYREITSKGGDVKIFIDAMIIVPDVEKYPVIHIDPKPITKNNIQLIADEFMNGETGYYPENFLIRSEIEEKLLEYYSLINNEDMIKEKYQGLMPNTEIDCDEINEAIKRKISTYTEMLENAPEEKESIPSNLNFRPREFYTTQDHNYRANELILTQEQLDMRENNLQENLYLVSDRKSDDEHIRLIVYNEMLLISGDQDTINLHSMEHYEVQIIRARNDYLILTGPPLCGTNPTNVSIEGVENFDTPYPDLTISKDEAIELAEQVLTFLPFAFEEIKMKISNESVVEFQWVNPTDASNVINENATLLSFDEIMEKAEKHIQLKYNMMTIAPVPKDISNYEEAIKEFSNAEIKISEIRLGLGGVPAYNATDEYMLIPVWNFYGSYEIDIIDDEKNYSYENMFIPLLCINAVDGSVIDQCVWADYN